MCISFLFRTSASNWLCLMSLTSKTLVTFGTAISHYVILKSTHCQFGLDIGFGLVCVLAFWWSRCHLCENTCVPLLMEVSYNQPIRLDLNSWRADHGQSLGDILSWTSLSSSLWEILTALLKCVQLCQVGEGSLFRQTLNPSILTMGESLWLWRHSSNLLPW